MKKSTILAIVTTIFLIVAPNSTLGEESCYELGYRYGLCATKSMLEIPCKSENDIVIPARCRGKEETKRGIKAGVKAVYDTLNLDEGSPTSSSSKERELL